MLNTDWVKRAELDVVTKGSPLKWLFKAEYLNSTWQLVIVVPFGMKLRGSLSREEELLTLFLQNGSENSSHFIPAHQRKTTTHKLSAPFTDRVIEEMLCRDFILSYCKVLYNFQDILKKS